MHRRLPTVTIVAGLAACLLAGCTTAPDSGTREPSGTPGSTNAATGGGASALPGCDEVTAVLGALADGLAFDAAVSEAQTADEAYEQRVCVYVTADAATQLGVTIAAIPFQQTEIDSYGTLPNAIADERLDARNGVLQTFAAGDGNDGHLDSALYLFDTEISVTIQGVSTSGPTTEVLPGLTLPAATDAAFAVRDLVA